MQRRDFIKWTLGAGGAAAGALAAPTVSALCPPGSRRRAHGLGGGKKILVIGAGMAGLAAAQDLRRLGHEVQILEARRVHRLAQNG